MAALNRFLSNVRGIGGVLRTARNIERLIRIKRKTLLKIASTYRAASTLALQVITGIVPIELQVKESVTK